MSFMCLYVSVFVYVWVYVCVYVCMFVCVCDREREDKMVQPVDILIKECWENFLRQNNVFQKVFFVHTYKNSILMLEESLIYCMICFDP